MFAAFFGTMPMSDFQPTFVPGLRPRAFPDRPHHLPWGIDWISRFPCIRCLRPRRFFDSGEPDGALR